MVDKLRCFAAAIALFTFSGAASAATLVSTASGNIDATATWSVVDTTGTNAYLNSESANAALATSAVASSAFTPAAETVTEIGVKLASVAASPSGTITVKLANSTSPGSRECSQTINVADLVSASASTAEGGWVILACSASPNGTDAYTITASTSAAAQVNLFSSAATNWSHLLVTSGTKTGGPAAGDKFIVAGQLTGAGTHNAYIVTIETTALVNYGNVANTLVDPSISVGQYGTLQLASAASTSYVSEFAGPMVIYNGGTFTVGTSGTPIPATSSATLTLNSTVEGDTGINVRNGGTFDSAGSSGGRNVVKTKLTVTATGGTTSTLTTADNTGWLSGDSIVIAGTQMTDGTAASVKSDAGTLSADATANSVPLTAAVTNTHTATHLSYTSTSTGIPYDMKMYADVILLNRNVVIQGNSSTTNGYIYLQASAHGAMDWTEFSLISGNIAGERGIEADTGQFGSLSITNSSFVNSHYSTLVLAPTNNEFGGTQSQPVLIQHDVFYDVDTGSANPSYAFGFLTSSFNPYVKIDDIAVVNCSTFNENAILLNSVTEQFTNISIAGSGNGGTPALTVTGTYGNLGVLGGQVGNGWGPITTYANVGPPARLGQTNASLYGTVSGFYIWHENYRFQVEQAGGDLTFDPFYIVTSSFGIYNSGNGSHSTFRNGVIGWDIATTTQVPVQQDSVPTTIYLDNMELCPSGTVGGVAFLGCNGSAPIALEPDTTPGSGTSPSLAAVYLRNSSLLNQGTSYPTMGQQESWYGTAFIAQDCNACAPVKHAAWVPGGFLSYDTAITHSSGYSLRMTPRVVTFSGYIAGTTLTDTSTPGSYPPATGDRLTSNGSGFIPGTYATSNLGSGNIGVSLSQTVGSSGSPVQFQMYSQYGDLPRMQSAPYGEGIKIAVASGQSAQACVWVRPSLSTDAAPPWGGSAATYNGDTPRLIDRANPYMGVQQDTPVSVTFTPALSAGTWSQMCGTLPTAPADGQYEVVVDADQTFTSNPGGSVNIAEWSCTNCKSPNTSQFWWNGAPADTVVPVSAPGTGGKGIHLPGLNGLPLN